MTISLMWMKVFLSYLSVGELKQFDNKHYFGQEQITENEIMVSVEFVGNKLSSLHFLLEKIGIKIDCF